MPSPSPPRIARGKMNVWTFLDLSETSSPPRPGVLERPTSLGRKQEIPPSWGQDRKSRLWTGEGRPESPPNNPQTPWTWSTTKARILVGLETGG